MPAAAFNVTGRVQGVWFRASTAEKAKALGLKGFVRNEPDGSVYIEAIGEDAALAELERWCHTGPELARVKAVERRQIDASMLEAYDEFIIQR